MVHKIVIRKNRKKLKKTKKFNNSHQLVLWNPWLKDHYHDVIETSSIRVLSTHNKIIINLYQKSTSKQNKKNEVFFGQR